MKYLSSLGLVALLAFFADPAAAGETYLKAFGGAGIHNDFGAEAPHVSFNADPDTGYVYGMAIGHSFDDVPGLAIELEAGFHHAGLNGILTVCGDESPLTGSTETFASLFNLVYARQIGPVTPYVFAGAGYGARRIVLEPTPDNWEINSSGADRQGFVWQGGAGVDYPLSERVKVGLEYVYFVGPESSRTVIWDGKEAFYESDGTAQEARLTLKVAL